MVTDWPTTSVKPNSSCAVVANRARRRWRPRASSVAVRNGRADRVRDRTSSQDGVVPTTVVVQFVDPAVSDSPSADVVAATAAMSGATTGRGQRLGVRLRSASTRCRSRRARRPCSSCCPGETISRLVPSELILRRHLPAGAPTPRPTVRIDCGDADQDAEHGQHRTAAGAMRIASRPVRSVSSQVIRDLAVRRRSVEGASATTCAVPHPDDPAGLRGHVGLVGDQDDGAARLVQLVEQRQHVCGRHRVEVAGRLVGQDQRRLGDQRPRHRDPLLLTAGQLAGPVLDPVAEADPVQRGDRPVAPLVPRHARVGQRQLDVAPAPSATATG